MIDPEISVTRTVTQGEFAASADPSVCLSAILGSCVSICVYDDVAGVGGMNHFLRPGDVNDDLGDIKYGIHAVELLINRTLSLGADRANLKAKVFGGANMNAALGDIGKQNGQFALSYLKDETIPVISESIGGNFARRIRFWPATGRAKQLIVRASDVATPEQRFTRAPSPDTPIELF